MRHSLDTDLTGKTPEFFLRQYRTMIVVQLRRRIFRQTIQIEEARVTPLPTKFVKYDGKDASKCAIKALAGNCAVLPKQ